MSVRTRNLHPSMVVKPTLHGPSAKKDLGCHHPDICLRELLRDGIPLRTETPRLTLRSHRGDVKTLQVNHKNEKNKGNYSGDDKINNMHCHPEARPVTRTGFTEPVGDSRPKDLGWEDFPRTPPQILRRPASPFGFVGLLRMTSFLKRCRFDWLDEKYNFDRLNLRSLVAEFILIRAKRVKGSSR
jgi:hypothetical protein